MQLGTQNGAKSEIRRIEKSNEKMMLDKMAEKGSLERKCCRKGCYPGQGGRRQIGRAWEGFRYARNLVRISVRIAPQHA